MATRAERVEKAEVVVRTYGVIGGDINEAARAILDAVLPQVSTVEELEALPVGSVVVTDEGDAFTLSHEYMCGTIEDVLTSTWKNFPLMVVWQP